MLKRRSPITFKTAALITIGLHVAGFVALSQWSSYKSRLAKAYKEQKDQELSSRDSNHSAWPTTGKKLIKVASSKPKEVVSDNKKNNIAPQSVAVVPVVKQPIVKTEVHSTRIKPATQDLVKAKPPKPVASSSTTTLVNRTKRNLEAEAVALSEKVKADFKKTREQTKQIIETAKINIEERNIPDVIRRATAEFEQTARPTNVYVTRTSKSNDPFTTVMDNETEIEYVEIIERVVDTIPTLSYSVR
jgi:hypothetical protein